MPDGGYYNFSSGFDTDDIDETSNRYFLGLLPTAAALAAVTITASTPRHRRSLSNHRKRMQNRIISPGLNVNNADMIRPQMINTIKKTKAALDRVISKKPGDVLPGEISVPGESVFAPLQEYERRLDSIKSKVGVTESADDVMNTLKISIDDLHRNKYIKSLDYKTLKKVGGDVLHRFPSFGKIETSREGMFTPEQRTMSIGRYVLGDAYPGSNANFDTLISQLDDMHYTIRSYDSRLRAISLKVANLNNVIETIKDGTTVDGYTFETAQDQLNTFMRQADDLEDLLINNRADFKRMTQVTAHKFTVDVLGGTEATTKLQEIVQPDGTTITVDPFTSIQQQLDKELARNELKSIAVQRPGTHTVSVQPRKSMNVLTRARAILREQIENKIAPEDDLSIGKPADAVTSANKADAAAVANKVPTAKVTDSGSVVNRVEPNKVSKLLGGEKLTVAGKGFKKQASSKFGRLIKAQVQAIKTSMKEISATKFKDTEGYGTIKHQSRLLHNALDKWNVGNANNMDKLLDTIEIINKKASHKITDISFGLDTGDHQMVVTLFSDNKNISMKMPVAYDDLYIGGEQGDLVKVSLGLIEKDKYGGKPVKTASQRIMRNMELAAERLANGDDPEKIIRLYEQNSPQFDALSHESPAINKRTSKSVQISSNKTIAEKEKELLGLYKKKHELVNSLKVKRSEVEKAVRESKTFAGSPQDTPATKARINKKVLGKLEELIHTGKVKVGRGKNSQKPITLMLPGDKKGQIGGRTLDSIIRRITSLEESALSQGGVPRIHELIKMQAAVGDTVEVGGVAYSLGWGTDVATNNAKLVLNKRSTLSNITAGAHKSQLTVEATEAQMRNKPFGSTIKWGDRPARDIPDLNYAEAGTWTAFVDDQYSMDEGNFYFRKGYMEKSFGHRKDLRGVIHANPSDQGKWKVNLNVGKGLEVIEQKSQDNSIIYRVEKTGKAGDLTTLGKLRLKGGKYISVRAGDVIKMDDAGTGNSLKVHVISERNPAHGKFAIAEQQSGHGLGLGTNLFDDTILAGATGTDGVNNRIKNIGKINAIASTKSLKKFPTKSFIGSWFHTVTQVATEDGIEDVMNVINNKGSQQAIKQAVLKARLNSKSKIQQVLNIFQNQIDGGKGRKASQFDIDALIHVRMPDAKLGDLGNKVSRNDIAKLIAPTTYVNNPVDLENALEIMAGGEKSLAGLTQRKINHGGKEVWLEDRVNEILGKNKWLDLTYRTGLTTVEEAQEGAMRFFYTSIHNIHEDPAPFVEAADVFDPLLRQTKGGMTVTSRELSTLASTNQTALFGEMMGQVQQRKSQLEYRFGWMYPYHENLGINLGPAAKNLYAIDGTRAIHSNAILDAKDSISIMKDIFGANFDAKEFSKMPKGSAEFVDGTSDRLGNMVSKIIAPGGPEISQADILEYLKRPLRERIDAGVLTTEEWDKLSKMLKKYDRLQLVEGIKVADLDPDFMRSIDIENTKPVKYSIRNDIVIPKHTEYGVNWAIARGPKTSIVAVREEIRDMLRVLTAATDDQVHAGKADYAKRTSRIVTEMHDNALRNFVGQYQSNVLKTTPTGSMTKILQGPTSFGELVSTSFGTTAAGTQQIHQTAKTALQKGSRAAHDMQNAMGVLRVTRSAAADSFEKILRGKVGKVSAKEWRNYVNGKQDGVLAVFNLERGYFGKDTTKFDTTMSEIANLLSKQQGGAAKYGDLVNGMAQGEFIDLTKRLSDDMVDVIRKRRIMIPAMEISFPNIRRHNVAPMLMQIMADPTSAAKVEELRAHASQDFITALAAELDNDGDLIQILPILDKEQQRQALKRMLRERVIVRLKETEGKNAGGIDFSKIDKIYSGSLASQRIDEFGTDLTLAAKVREASLKGEVLDSTDDILYMNPSLVDENGRRFVSVRTESVTSENLKKTKEVFGHTFSDTEIKEVADEIDAAILKEQPTAHITHTSMGADLSDTTRKVEIDIRSPGKVTSKHLADNTQNMGAISNNVTWKIVTKQGPERHVSFYSKSAKLTAGTTTLQELQRNLERVDMWQEQFKTSPYLKTTESSVIKDIAKTMEARGATAEEAALELESKWNTEWKAKKTSNNKLSALQRLIKQYDAYKVQGLQGRPMENFLSAKATTGPAAHFQDTYLSTFRMMTYGALGTATPERTEGVINGMQEFMARYQQNSIGGKHGIAPVTSSIIQRFQSLSLQPKGAETAAQTIQRVQREFGNLWEGKAIKVAIDPLEHNLFAKQFAEAIHDREVGPLGKPLTTRDQLGYENFISSKNNQIYIEDRIKVYENVQKDYQNIIGQLKQKDLSRKQAQKILNSNKAQQYAFIRDRAKKPGSLPFLLEKEVSRVGTQIKGYQKAMADNALKSTMAGYVKDDIRTALIANSTVQDMMGTEWGTGDVGITTNRVLQNMAKNTDSIFAKLLTPAGAEFSQSLLGVKAYMKTAGAGISAEMSKNIPPVLLTEPGMSGFRFRQAGYTARSSGDHLADMIGRGIKKRTTKGRSKPAPYTMAKYGKAVMGMGALGLIAISALMPSVLPGDSAGVGGEYYEHQRGKSDERGRKMKEGELIADQLTYGRRHIKIRDDKWKSINTQKREQLFQQLINPGASGVPVYRGNNTSQLASLLRG